MTNIASKTIKSKNQPRQTNVTWIDMSGETPIEKHFINGRWIAVSGGSGGSGSSFRNVIVDTTEYPTIDAFVENATGENGVIYLYPSSQDTDNTYTELLWIEDDEKFEIIDRDIPIDSTPTSASTNPVSSGGVYTALESKQDTLTFDSVPTENSSNPVESGGVYDAIYPVVETTMPQTGFLPNMMYELGELNSATTFSLNTTVLSDNVKHYYWTFETGATPPTITWPIGIMWSTGQPPATIGANCHYEVSVINGYAVYMEYELPTVVEP